MICTDILSFWKINRLHFESDEGFRFGRTDKEVTGIQFCWKATLEAIEEAHKNGCNMMIAHEELSFPPAYTGASFESDLCGPTFQRLRLLSRYDITLLRGHASLDELGFVDTLASRLGFSNPNVYGNYYQRNYKIGPMTFDALCSLIKERLELPYLRASGDGSRMVSCAALAWGGIGISASSQILDYVTNGADVVICGESEELPFLAYKEIDTCYVETSHSATENMGLLFARQMISAHFPEVPMYFYENKRPWELVKRGALC
jgi:putative NIF3 family GTP cyclohydrolase 1 type 2